MKKRQALTLIEIMVVLFIITIITSVVAVNMKGTMKEGKVFKSEKGSKQVYDIISLEMAKDPEVVQILMEEPETILKNSGLVADPKKTLQDGWGEKFQVRYCEEDGEIKVTSKKWIQNLKEKGLNREKILEQYPWIDPNEVQEDLYAH